MIVEMIKRMLPAFAGHSLVAIELGERIVRAVMVKKTVKGIVVTRVRSEERGGDSPAEALDRLLAADGGFKGPAILVTDQVKFLASEISVEGAENLSQEKLDSAAMWEIEPYLDFPPASGLFACRLLKTLKSEEATPALIFAMERDAYGQWSQRLKKRGLDLRRAYSPEGALARAVRMPAAGKHKIIVDCHPNALKGVLLTADGPSIFQDLPLMEAAAPDQETVGSMLYDLTASADGVEEVVLAGDAVSPEMVAGLGAEFAGLRLWGEADIGGLDGGLDETDFGPGYASALGAVAQELDPAGGAPLGVTDRVSLAARTQQVFQKNKRLAPALTVGLLLVCLAGHHMLTRSSIAGYQSRIEILEKEKRRLLRPREEKERLTEALADLQRRQAYLETVLAAGNRNLMSLLAAISEALPRDVVLNRLYQKDSGSYWIEGNAFRGGSVYALNETLSRIEGCTATHLETLRRVEEASDARQKLLPYEFVINLKFQ
jgi:Tfp pilus assembly protein PilN